MKLTVNRRETIKGMLFKRTEYELETKLEISEQERQTIMKHFSGASKVLATGRFANGNRVPIPIMCALDTQTFSFATLDDLARFENEFIEGIKHLKSAVEAAGSYTTGGPREIDL